jgi:hypothetical protein
MIQRAISGAIVMLALATIAFAGSHQTLALMTSFCMVGLAVSALVIRRPLK